MALLRLYRNHTAYKQKKSSNTHPIKTNLHIFKVKTGAAIEGLCKTPRELLPKVQPVAIIFASGIFLILEEL